MPSPSTLSPRTASLLTQDLDTPLAPAANDTPVDDVNSPSQGAEAAAVLGGSFSAIQAIVQNEDRVIEELFRRSHSRASKITDPATGDSRGPYRYNGTPMIITTEAFASQGRYLVFWSGPSNTSWTFELRASKEQTRSGTIYHYWRNQSRSSYFDEPSVTFTFQSGNIMPVRFREGEGDSATESLFLPPGLLDYYDFFDMLNQPKILPDGRPNFVFISYHSLVYPDIFLRGFFDPTGIKVEEKADDPTSITWSATFKIRSTEPPFWSSAQLISTWNSTMGGGSENPDLTFEENSPVTGQGPQG